MRVKLLSDVGGLRARLRNDQRTTLCLSYLDASKSAKAPSRMESRRLNETSFRFFVLSCRDPRTDFRRPLVEALRRHNETWYVFLKRRPVVQGPTADCAPVEMSFLSFLAWQRRTARGGKDNVFFNSTNAAFPLVIPALRFVSPSSIWCMDMHDDLLYDLTGFKRLRAFLTVRVQTAISSLTVHAAASLIELFPFSKHLGNASHIKPLTRPVIDLSRILILASLDQRFDFDLTAEAARICPDKTFHIYGQISLNNQATRTCLETMLSSAPNIIYHGAYTLADLEGILQTYSVSFAPYRIDHRLTRYIDPLRFYHCLNSGIDVITTPIPHARTIQHCVHIVRNAVEFVNALEAILHSQKNAVEVCQPCYWNQRADQLVGLLEDVRNAKRSVQLKDDM